jgi:16S rRNA (cytosine967-C5)-methyltransferase
MTPPARLSAAIEVLSDIEATRRPAPDALKAWGLAHRFAGSGDRAAIASLVYDALRRRKSGAWLAGEDNPRGMLLGMLHLMRGMSVDEIAAMCSGERFAPEPLNAKERLRLTDARLADAPAHIQADFPKWIAGPLQDAFGDDLVPELTALATRAPLDLRVNTLRGTRDEAMAELAHLNPVPTPHAPNGLRIMPSDDGRGPAVHAEPAFLKGMVEIQDEGSQLAALLSGAKPGQNVIDLCAGGGGKTLALAAMMANEGQIFATDSDIRRLAPIHDRLARAGVTIVEVRTPRAKADAMMDLNGTADLVLVDAPCTGSGTWRRNPDAKWRLRPGSLSPRVTDQATVLDRAVALARPGGRIVYITCSVLPQENDEAIAGLLARHKGWHKTDPRRLLADAGLSDLSDAVRVTSYGLQMTPLRTGTDGFYIALLRRS